MAKASLAFSGSGYLAPIHAGFACAFLDNKVQIVETAGTSGGSIIAAAVAIGMGSSDLRSLVFSTWPKNIVDYSVFQGVHSVLADSFWLNNGEVLTDFLNSIFEGKRIKDAKIPLTIMATNLSQRSTLEFSNSVNAEEQISFACRCSSSVPYVYKPMLFNGDLIIDGGVRNNIPTNKLTAKFSKKVGIRVIDSTPPKINSVISMSMEIINNLLDANEDNLDSWASATGATISMVDANPYTFLDSGLEPDQKQVLFNRGQDAALKVLQNMKV